MTSSVATESLSRAIALFSSQSYKEALASLQPAIEVAPDDPDVSKLHATILGKLGRASQALAILEGVPQADDADWLRIRGHMLDQLGNKDAAEESIRASIQLEPGCAASHYVLGRILIAQGRSKTSLEDRKTKREGHSYLRRAIILEPENVEARIALAWDLYGNRNKEVEQMVRECLELAFEHPAARSLAGYVAMGNGNLSEARDHAEFLMHFPEHQAHAHELIAHIDWLAIKPFGFWHRFAWKCGRQPITSYIPYVPMIAITIYICFHFDLYGTQIYTTGGLIGVLFLIPTFVRSYFAQRSMRPTKLNRGY